jgi:hypothetical protein
LLFLASSVFSPYHCPWHYDAPNNHITITSTLGAMISALGSCYVSILPKPIILH